MNSATMPANGEAMPEDPRTLVDPLRNLVRAYRVAVERLNASENGSEEEERAEAHMLWLVARLTHDTPECWTTQGAQEALQLVAEDMNGSIGGFHEPVLRRVMEFAEMRQRLN